VNWGWLQGEVDVRVHARDTVKNHIVVLVDPDQVNRNAHLIRRICGVGTVFVYTNGMLSVYVIDRDFGKVLSDIESLHDEGT